MNSGNEQNNFSLCEAAAEGNVDDVSRLVQLCDASWFDNLALREAACGGHTRCVELLIPHSSVHKNSLALREAAANGRHECVKILIGVCDPNDFPNILQSVVRGGCSKSVALVLQQVSNIEIITAALEIAAIHNRCDCVDLLYPHANVGAALESLTNSYAHYQKFWQPLQNRYDAEQQNTVLREAVRDVQHSARSAKI